MDDHNKMIIEITKEEYTHLLDGLDMLINAYYNDNWIEEVKVISYLRGKLLNKDIEIK